MGCRYPLEEGAADAGIEGREFRDGDQNHLPTSDFAAEITLEPLRPAAQSCARRHGTG